MSAGPHSFGRSSRAFSLVEVVIAIGIITFAVIGIIGLWAVGMRTSSDSSETTAAANLANVMLNQRRLVPVDSASWMLTNFGLPSINLATNNYAKPVYVGEDGYTTNAAYASFGAVFNVIPRTRSSTVYFVLYWPVQASLTNAVGRYEINTEIAWP